MSGELAAMFSSDRMDWETPSDVFSELDAEFGFTVDVCARADNTKCSMFFTPEQDGLKQPWSGVCWMNPPYGHEIKRWMRKAYQEWCRGVTVVCLVPARTDTAWWHDYAAKATEIRFVRGRIKFVGAKHGAPFPSAVVIFKSGGAA